ncbi:lysine transporter LysE [Enemella evansiae]|uniref:LysE family translocator n=1 Tax=Enemella evansiae TaxID=2016499 RepID=UPI000B968AA5|nr:LysE family translocator [Enemella evansiae]OYO09775.1 lysine transporter LysE [Enemella evansiae]
MAATWTFLVVIIGIVLMPGADFMLTLRNALLAGRRAGFATLAGVGVAGISQAVLTSIGVGALIVRVQPLFLAIKWLGLAYLLWLACQALRSAWRGEYADAPAESTPRRARRGFIQGFLCNATNPKIFLFFLALLPQFVAPDAPLVSWLGHALALPALGSLWLAAVVRAAERLRSVLLRPRVRRGFDLACGGMLAALGVRLATEN